MSDDADALLAVRDLVVEYPGTGWRRAPHRVLHGVSLHIGQGETLGLVGESGSGKTTLGRAILGLVTPTSGTISYGGEDITTLDRARRRHLAPEIQVIFQDPYSSLNPSLKVEEILAEPLRAVGVRPVEASNRVRALLDRVGLPADASRRLPREFSGGQRQRIAIARALALDPKVIVCDEPVSALDLSTQARVLDLLVEIQEQTGVAYLIISHDLSVVRCISHRVAVMYRGSIVELGDAGQVIENPQHPYTQRLLLAAPVSDPVAQRERREARRQLKASGAFFDVEVHAP
ncbi:MAG TPA: ATP-binding cassette domain-containing protein [Homoserinimonas sp.]|nr:ATP-binding cassette domain-containing protein [Homoserinimonas sp.]